VKNTFPGILFFFLPFDFPLKPLILLHILLFFFTEIASYFSLFFHCISNASFHAFQLIYLLLFFIY